MLYPYTFTFCLVATYIIGFVNNENDFSLRLRYRFWYHNIGKQNSKQPCSFVYHIKASKSLLLHKSYGVVCSLIPKYIRLPFFSRNQRTLSSLSQKSRLVTLEIKSFPKMHIIQFLCFLNSPSRIWTLVLKYCTRYNV